MNISFDTQSPSVGILTIHIEPEDYQPVWEKNLAQYKQNIKLKGFRKGHTPTATVKKMYGPHVLQESIFQVGEQAVYDYLTKYKIAALGAPILKHHTVHAVSPAQPNTCTLTYHIGFIPPFDLPDFTKLRVKAYKVKPVEEKDLHDILQAIRASYATFQSVDTAALGHILDGRWEVKGETLDPPYYIPLDDKTQALHTLFLGKQAGTRIALSTEDLRILHALKPLPETLQDALQDRPDTTFTFHLQGIYHRQLPPLNPEFYTKVLGTAVESEADFRTKLTQTLLAKDEAQAQKLFENTVKDAVIQATQLPLPEHILKTWLQVRKEAPMTAEEVEAQYPMIAANLRWELILDKLTETHALKPSSEELQEDLMHFLRNHPTEAHATPVDEEAIQQKAHAMLANSKDNLAARIAKKLQEEKALALLKATLHVEETSITSKAFYAMLRTSQEELQTA